MSAYLYDEALLNKLKKWSAGTDVTITGVEETRRLLEVIADRTNDNPIKLPLFCLRRNGGFSIDTLSKKPLSYDSLVFKATDERSSQLNAIPITINYQLDIYTRFFKEADEYARNLVFNIINYPKLEIEIPYEDAHYPHVANIRPITGVVDNSNIPERLVAGQFTRFTIGINIDDAYLFDVRTRDNYSIGFQMRVDDEEPIIQYNINPETDFFPE